MRSTVMVVGLVLCGGCGPAAQQPQGDAAVANRPPRILSGTPKLRSTWYASTSCLPLNSHISLTVEDADGDPLRSLWFIDQSAASAPFLGSTRAGGPTTQAVEAPAALAFRSALANLPGGVHLLTAYVADSEFNEVVDGSVTVTRQDGFVDSFTWVLDVEPCP